MPENNLFKERIWVQIYLLQARQIIIFIQIITVILNQWVPEKHNIIKMQLNI